MKFKKPKPMVNPKRKKQEIAANEKSESLPYSRRRTPNEPFVITSGPLVTIELMSQEALSRDAELFDALGGNDVIRVVGAMLSRENTMEEIAFTVWCFYAWYCAASLGNVDASSLRPINVPAIAAAMQPYGPTIFEQLARRRCVNAYVCMRTELEQRDASLRMNGTIPYHLIHGNYWMVRRTFMREFGSSCAASIENLALMSAIKVVATAYLTPLGLDFRPPRALEYIAGIRDSPDWFLASDVDIAMRCGDVTRAKELIMDPGTFNQTKWLPEHLFVYGKVLAHPHWKTADAPLHYVPSAASKTLRNERRADLRDQINARKAGLVRVEAECKEDQDHLLEQVVARDGFFEGEVMAQHDLNSICDSERLPLELRAVVTSKYGKRRDDRLGETPLLSNWNERRIAAANQRLKAGEKWGEALRGSESVRFYSSTPPASRYGAGLPQTAARTGHWCACGLMTKREATKLRHECSPESKRLAEFVQTEVNSVFGKRLGRFLHSRFHSQEHAPEMGAASEVRILVRDGKITPLGEAAGIKIGS